MRCPFTTVYLILALKFGLYKDRYSKKVVHCWGFGRFDLFGLYYVSMYKKYNFFNKMQKFGTQRWEMNLARMVLEADRRLESN